jgi:peptidoglycan/xylan/chitin deacetylase (PgdA/CDA1 family)
MRGSKASGVNILDHLRERAHRRFNRAYGACICASQADPLLGCPKTVVTTFFDFEGSYGMAGATDRCLAAMKRIVEIQRRHGIRSTYNVVALHALAVPEVLAQLRADGHEIASHSYDHSVLARVPSSEQLHNIRASEAVFKELGIPIRGHRSPQSRWDVSLMRNLCSEGHGWTAENGREPHPYVVHRNARGRLWRFPVIADDWAYESMNLPPQQMLEYWQAVVNDARRSKRYTAIGFHPWIQCSEHRLETLDRFMAWLRSLPDVEPMPFGELHALLEAQSAA